MPLVRVRTGSRPRGGAARLGLPPAHRRVHLGLTNSPSSLQNTNDTQRKEGAKKKKRSRPCGEGNGEEGTGTNLLTIEVKCLC